MKKFKDDITIFSQSVLRIFYLAPPLFVPDFSVVFEMSYEFVPSGHGPFKSTSVRRKHLLGII